MEREPHRIAITLDGRRSLTMADWDARSNAVAHGLLERGAEHGDRVALYFDRTRWIEYAICYLGVLKAGGVVVAMSSGLSPHQTRFRIALSGARLLVHPDDATPPEVDVPSVAVDDLADGDAGPVAVTVRPEDLAEINFTSGTTGDSKGVSATHENITYDHAVLPMYQQYVGRHHLLTAFPMGTTAAQSMAFLAMVAEPTLIVMSKFDAESLAAIVESLRVDSMLIVPAMAVDLVNSRAGDRYDLTSVEYVSCGSAALAVPMANQLVANVFPNAEIVNVYGSTETMPISFSLSFSSERAGSVGKVPDGVEMFLADADGNPVPQAETGEVLVRSAAPLRAYYHDPEATEHTFGSGWIHTGDFGHLDKDGYLFLVDRDKDVVKVGGLKVSTLQVESALFEHPDVADAAVVGIPHPVMGRMVAAAVMFRRPVELVDLRTFLRDRLTAYEIPTRFMSVYSLPRNPMGKVLKREIRDMFATQSRSDTPRIAPSGPTETALARMWVNVLGEEPCVDDDFFALGGDSLGAARLAACVTDELGVEMPVSAVFDVPVLAHQAEWIANQRGAPIAATRPAVEATGELWTAGPDRSGGLRIPLNSWQARQFTYMRRSPTPLSTLPTPLAYRITEPFDVDVFRAALKELVDRHDSLRTYFLPTADGRIDAVVRDTWDPHLSVTEVHGDTEDDRLERARRMVRHFVSVPFALERGELFRSLVIRLADDDHVILLVLDHMVSDMLSIDVLRRDLAAVYTAFRDGQPSPLRPLAWRESDFVIWAHEQYDGNRSYWQRTLDGAPGWVGPLPGQRVTSGPQDNRGLEFGLPSDLARRIGAAYPGHGITLYMAGLSVWSSVLSSLAGSQDVVMTSAMSGRTRPESEPLVGSIVQTVNLRIHTDGNPTFAELFSRVRRTVVEANEHQIFEHCQFTDQIPYPARFSLEYLSAVPTGLTGVDSSPFPVSANLVSRTAVVGGQDLNVPRMRMIERPNGKLGGLLSYNTHAFAESSVRAMANEFVRRLEAALERPDARLSEFG
ncbi:MAG TPA: AMP-binding protein [Pseudonocardiaceae bacterium]|nr:AMP-binding protein [Pseudonocardiaceae bacterium]